MTEIPEGAHITLMVPPMPESELVTHLHKIIADLRLDIARMMQVERDVYRRGYEDAERDYAPRDAAKGEG